jgi:hypothetical protein
MTIVVVDTSRWLVTASMLSKLCGEGLEVEFWFSTILKLSFAVSFFTLKNSILRLREVS